MYVENVFWIFIYSIKHLDRYLSGRFSSFLLMSHFLLVWIYLPNLNIGWRSGTRLWVWRGVNLTHGKYAVKQWLRSGSLKIDLNKNSVRPPSNAFLLLFGAAIHVSFQRACPPPPTKSHPSNHFTYTAALISK